MNRQAILILAATVAGSAALSAQTNPMSTEVKQAYNGIKNNLIKMAEKMPEENYSFKPTPDIRAFGALVGHVADSQLRTCTAVKGEMKNGTASTKTAKAELVAALKESFAECDAAYDSLTDATAGEMIKTARGQRTKLGALVGNTTHSNEEYGYMSVYLRLKGVVPPSSEGR
ncbi:MAG: DinB family protein [Bryobacteraceae bacterium]